MSGIPAWAVASLGAAQTSLVIPMQPWKFQEVDLSEHGVPKDARILARIYTSQSGDIMAVEWHANAPPLRFLGTTLRLIGVPFGGGPASGTGSLGISVVWIRGEESEEWSYLVTALEAAAAHDYAPALVFAQSAVEVSMMPVIEDKFRMHAPANKVKRFANYSRALDVILPYLCGEAGLPKMPIVVHEALDRLRDRRNTIIHRGAKYAAIGPEEAMEGLCAAAFGVEFIRFIKPQLLGTRRVEQP